VESWISRRQLPAGHAPLVPETGRFGFTLAFERFARLVSPTRRFVEEAVEQFIADPEEVFRIAMTAHELLENAVKYGTGPMAELRVTIDRTQTESTAELHLTNGATPDDIERLRLGISALARSPQPFAHYQALMLKDLDKPDVSCLGLARIVAEGHMSLSLEVSGLDVTLTARGTWRADGAR
jgi:hypothetical protein